jgi:hypothetical protein
VNLNNVTKLLSLAQILHKTNDVVVEIFIKQDTTNGFLLAANEHVPSNVELDVTGAKTYVRVRFDGHYDGLEFEDILEGVNRYVARLEAMSHMQPQHASTICTSALDALRNR